MFVYIIASVLSVFFAMISDKWYKQKKQFAINETENISNKHQYGIHRHLRLKTLSWTLHISKSSFFAFFSFLPLYLVSAFRYMVGTDYAGTYKSIYAYTYKDGWHFKFFNESLYGLLNKIASFYSGEDYTGVFALSSLVICGFIFMAVRKQSVDMPYSVLLFVISGFYFWSFNSVRQMAAIAIFVFAYQYIEREEPLKYIVCILFASGFHKMALLYLPVYFIKKLKLDFKLLFILSLILVLFPAIFRTMAYTFISKIWFFDTYIQRYFKNSRFENYTESSFAHVFINLAFLSLFILISKFYDKKTKSGEVWISFQFLAFAFASLASVLPLANRISRLFSVMQILSIPFMTRLISDIRLRIFVNLSIIVCYLTYCIVTFYVLGYHDVFPYQTIFER